MRNPSQEEVQEKLKRLSPELRSALFSSTNTNKIVEIPKRHNLLIDQIGELSTEVGNILLGISHPNSFVSELQGRLGIDTTTVKSIAREINQEIFIPLTEQIKKLHNMAPGEQISFEGPGMDIGQPEPRVGTVKTVESASSFDDLKSELQHMIEKDEPKVPPAPPKPAISNPTAPQPPNLASGTPSASTSAPAPQSTYRSVDPYRETFEDKVVEDKQQVTKAFPRTILPSKDRLSAPEDKSAIPTPTPFRVGVFQQKPRSSAFEQQMNQPAENNISEAKLPKIAPIPKSTEPPTKEVVLPFKPLTPVPPTQPPTPTPPKSDHPALNAHVTTPTGFRGFKMTPDNNLAAISEKEKPVVEENLGINKLPSSTPELSQLIKPTAPNNQPAPQAAPQSQAPAAPSGDPYHEPLS